MQYGANLKAAAGTDIASIYSGTAQDIRDNVPNDYDTTNSLGNYFIVGITPTCRLRSGAVAQEATLSKLGRSGIVLCLHIHMRVSTNYLMTVQHRIDPEP